MVPANIVGVGVDRFTLDRTYIAVGDLMQFPIAARFGVEVLHFGTSTGVARLDTLSSALRSRPRCLKTVRRREAWNSPGQPHRGSRRRRRSLFHASVRWSSHRR